MIKPSIIILAAAFSVGPTSLVLAQEAPLHQSPHKVLVRSCEQCHVATSFKQVRFDHSDTAFALDGHHRDVNCLFCHSIENFARVKSSCRTCHEDVHLGRMGLSCERCHVSESWKSLDMEGIHANTNFPLMGRHIVLDCESCHAGMSIAKFRQTPSQCVACHRADYDNAVALDHAASGISTECQECHQMTAWLPAGMPNHEPLFPIFSGTHNNTWSDCSACHPSTANRKAFTCLTCHEHDQPSMDGVHGGMQGYSYTSQACLGCHPDGRAGFFGDHDAQFFPIYSGAHNRNWADCATCHTTPSNKSVFTCLSCHDHDQARMDDKHLGEVQDYSYDSASCFRCHPNGRTED
jgi:hypothetical protein